MHDLDSDSNNCSILILIYHHSSSSTMLISICAVYQVCFPEVIKELSDDSDIGVPSRLCVTIIFFSGSGGIPSLLLLPPQTEFLKSGHATFFTTSLHA